MYVVTSIPLVSRTRATLRSAELGFFGVCVNTRTHTPRFCGLFCNAGLFVLLTIFLRPARTSWLMVGIERLCWPPPEGRHVGGTGTWTPVPQETMQPRTPRRPR